MNRFALTLASLLLLSSCTPQPADKPAVSSPNPVGSIVRLDPAFDALVPQIGTDRKTGRRFPV